MTIFMEFISTKYALFLVLQKLRIFAYLWGVLVEEITEIFWVLHQSSFFFFFFFFFCYGANFGTEPIYTQKFRVPP